MNRSIKIPAILFLVSLLYWPLNECRAQDEIPVTGRIIGASNHALSGVAVSIEGVYTEPVITDTSGKFELTAPNGHVWLMINPAEKYKSKRLYLNGRNILTIHLTPEDLESGDDEVITLFQSVSRRNLVSSYTAPDLENAILHPNQSIGQYLQYMIPGLFATGSSGMPGSGTVSSLRGLKSMYTSNQPLYIVDGLPIETPGLFQSQLDGNLYSPLASINPLDITNITYLKDYMGTAIYGMRASNGVVLIETLAPTKVETTIDFTFRTGISMEPGQIPQLDAGHYKALAAEVLMSSGIQEEDFKLQYPALYSTRNNEEHYKYNNNTNWQDLIFSNALSNDFYMRVLGGDEIARYGLSVSYLNHKGIINNTGYERFSVRFVGNFNIFKWLRMYVSSNLNTGNSEIKESALARQTSPLLTALLKPPLLIPYEFDDKGNQLSSLANVGPLGVSNPLGVIEGFRGTNKNNRATTSFRIEADIGKYLKWNSLLGLNFNTLSEKVFMPSRGMELYYGNEAYNVSKSLKNYLFSIYSDNFLNFSKDLGSRHSLNAVAGFRFHINRHEVDWGIAKNLQESDEYKQLQNGISFLREMGGLNSRWNRLAFYGNAGYSFADRYFLETNLAAENSTRIGKNAQNILEIGGRPFGMFYSAGGAWRISGEPFLRDLTWLEDLRLRVSYGITGNDDIGNLSGLDYYSTVHYREATGVMAGPLTKQDLKHERVSQLNAGLDVSFWGNRLQFSVDRFNVRTENLLVFEPQPYYIGYTTVPTNTGTLINKGLEFSFSMRILELGKLKWDLGFNVTNLVNQVEDITDGQVITSFPGGEFISRVGEPVLSFYGLEYQGVFSTKEEAAKAGLTTEKGVAFTAGDAIFKDISGPDGTPDNVINEHDRTILGSPIPDYFGNINNQFTWGRWSLSTIIQFVSGPEVFNFVRSLNEGMTGMENQSAHVLNRWSHEGQITDVPKTTWDDPLGNAAFSSRWIEDGSYLRIKNLSLSYTVPDKFLFFRNAQFFVTATNLYTVHNYLGYDPEFSYSYFTMEQGIDYGNIPHTRRFMLGIRFGL